MMLYNDWALQTPLQTPPSEAPHVKLRWPDLLIKSLGPQTVDDSFSQNGQFVVPETWTKSQLKHVTQAVERYVFALTKAPNDQNVLPCELLEQFIRRRNRIGPTTSRQQLTIEFQNSTWT
jgi:hypothetical protein